MQVWGWACSSLSMLSTCAHTHTYTHTHTHTGSWLFESVADVQKIRFVKETGKAQRGDASHHPAAGDASHHHATLGLAPYDGSAYWYLSLKTSS